MRQLLQNLRNGQMVVEDVPVPQVRAGKVLVHTAASLVSAGTERMVVEFAEKNLFEKARSRPDLVRQMLDKARREGILPTLQAAFNRLDQPMVLGYSSAGEVIGVGEGVQGIRVGDRVACAGGNYAVHAEYALVPQNLLAPLPAQVDDESAAFTTLGAIALHGFRLAQPQLGERVAVIGLGLLGLLAVGVARAAGCAVFGVDLDTRRIALGEKMGAVCVQRPLAEEAGKAFTQQAGFDIVLICADTRSNDPIELAGHLARDRGRVVAIGAVGLNIPRKRYYEKELQFQVSRSYGPGRYDAQYEEKGLDYPAGYVRWTEGRNLAAFVELLANRSLDVRPLISHRFPIENALQAYELITGKRTEPFLGVLLTYPQEELSPRPYRVDNPLASASLQPQDGALCLGVLGAGNYANAVFLPVVRKVGGISRLGIASGNGLTAQHAARRFDFGYASSLETEVLEDQQVNIVAILSRHQHHARQVMAALRLGKHVYCEKPLAITMEELDEIAECLKTASALLAVGFNRRFAPFAVRLRNFLQARNEPLAAHYRVNAGYLPTTHWLHDVQQGGGRVIGEGCHFIDFLSFLVGAPPVEVTARGLPDQQRYCQDNVVLSFVYPDGSLGTLTYLANGDKSCPKEHIEVFCGGQVGILDDFRRLELYQNGSRRVFQSWLSQEKGHRQAWESFLNVVRAGGAPPIPYDHLTGVSRAALVAAQALRSGNTHPVKISG